MHEKLHIVRDTFSDRSWCGARQWSTHLRECDHPFEARDPEPYPPEEGNRSDVVAPSPWATSGRRLKFPEEGPMTALQATDARRRSSPCVR